MTRYADGTKSRLGEVVDGVRVFAARHEDPNATGRIMLHPEDTPRVLFDTALALGAHAVESVLDRVDWMLNPPDSSKN